MTTDPRTLKKLAERGINYCRQGDWDTGMACLARVAEVEDGSQELPSLFYSYLGFGIAYRERRMREGVENENQAAYLKGHGCQVMQGYLFGKPVRVADFLNQVAAGRGVREKLTEA